MINKSLLKVNVNLLEEYNDFEKANPGNWDIASYLNVKYDMNAAIAFSKLFFPNFVLIEDCVILEFRYDEAIFRQWVEKFDRDVTNIEYICNSYDIMDFFLNNVSTDESNEIYNQRIDEFANILKTTWEINCKALFPERKMTVKVFDEYNTTRITIFTEA